MRSDGRPGLPFLKLAAACVLAATIVLTTLVAAIPALAQEVGRELGDSLEIGYVRISLQAGPEPVDSFLVVVDGNFRAPIVTSASDSIPLSRGRHQIVVASAHAYDASFSVDVVPDSTRHLGAVTAQALSLDAALRQTAFPVVRTGANLLVVSDEDAAIYIDGAYIGRGTAKQMRPPGGVDVEVRTSFGRRSERVFVREGRLAAVEIYHRPSRRKSLVLGFVPGAVQMHRRQTVRAGLIAGGFAAAGAMAIERSSRYRSANDSYLQSRARYDAARTEDDARRLGEVTEALYERAQSIARQRNVIYGVVGVLYALNLTDAWRPPRYGYRTPTRGVYALLAPIMDTDQFGLTVEISF